MTAPFSPASLRADGRDVTKEPPAYLDPLLVLKARRWLMTPEGWEELKKSREGTRNDTH